MPKPIKGKLEFTEGQGIQTKHFLWVVCGYFLEQHIAISYNGPKLFSWKSLFMTLPEYKLNEKITIQRLSCVSKEEV